MNTSTPTSRYLLPRPGPAAGWCLSVILSVGAAAAVAVAETPAADIQLRYDQERSRCMNGMSNQDRTTCLKEAGAARDEARKGRIEDGGANYDKNAKQRCGALTGDEARDCMLRMKAPNGTTARPGAAGSANAATSTSTSTSGSAEAGGVVRETVTRETRPVPADAAASAR
jgi:hypothetical protein